MTNSKAKIYTGIGDRGTTKLVDGSCVEKFNPRVEAYGSLDELNSYLGVVMTYIDSKTSSLKEDIERIQNLLFNLGSLLACADQMIIPKLPPLHHLHIEALENRIDEFDESLPELKEFIIPGGHPLSAQIHVARTLCRKSERKVSELIFILDQNKELSPTTKETYECGLIYLNRLSDFLFTAARWVNFVHHIQEPKWRKV